MLSKTTVKSNTEFLTDLFIILIALACIYALWIGSYPLFTPDEGRYSEVAREMVASGDYITPRLNGVVFMDKPVLYYWLQALAIHAFGLKEWALRFWPAALGILGCLMTYISGRILFNRRTGILSAIILATTPMYYGAAHYANLDLEVAVLISITLLSFVTAVKTEKQSLFLLTYIAAGLAVLTKGLIGIAFPGLIIGSWILLLNRWSLLKKIYLFRGIVIFSLIVVPWYLLVQKANPEFFHFFFVLQQVSRFLTKAHFNNQAPFWFYLPIVIAGFFPWSLFVIQAISQKAKQAYQQRQQFSSELFLLLWAFFIFVFFSIPKSKTVGYILPIFPALALLTGSYLTALWSSVKFKGISWGIYSFIVIALGVAVTLSLLPYSQFEYNHLLNPYLFFASGVLIFSGLITFLLFRKNNFPGIFYSLLTTTLILLLTFIQSANYMNEKSIKPLALELKKYLKPNDEVITFYKYYQDLPIYLEKRITIVEDWKADDIPLNDNWVRELWYGMPFQNTQAWLIDETNFWQRWNSSNKVFVLTDVDHYATIVAKAKNKVIKLAQHNQVVLITNSKAF